jgi:hypothetical protein
MRLHDSTDPQVTTPDSAALALNHPVLKRALEAHRGDQVNSAGVSAPQVSLDSPGACSRLVRFSKGFLGDARRAGLTAPEVRAALGSGVRERCWDGCLLVQDWFQGVELKLDPSGRFGLTVRRTHAVN